MQKEVLQMLSEYKRESRAAANKRGIAVDLFDTLDISKQKNTNTKNHFGLELLDRGRIQFAFLISLNLQIMRL